MLLPKPMSCLYSIDKQYTPPFLLESDMEQLNQQAMASAKCVQHQAKPSIGQVFGTMQQLGALINADETRRFIDICDPDLKRGLRHHQSMAKKHMRQIGDAVGIDDIDNLGSMQDALADTAIDKALVTFNEIQPQVLLEIKIFEAAKAVMAS